MDLQSMNKDMLIKLIQTCKQDLEEKLKEKEEFIQKGLNIGVICVCSEKDCEEICFGFEKCVSCSATICKNHTLLYHMDDIFVPVKSCGICETLFKAGGWKLFSKLNEK